MAGPGGALARSRGIAKYVISGAAVVTFSDTPAVGIAMPDTAVAAMIVCEDQPIRWRDDGTSPNGTTGLPLYAGSVMDFDGDMQKFRMARGSTATGDATVWVAWRGI